MFLKYRYPCPRDLGNHNSHTLLGSGQENKVFVFLADRLFVFRFLLQNTGLARLSDCQNDHKRSIIFRVRARDVIGAL